MWWIAVFQGSKRDLQSVFRSLNTCLNTHDGRRNQHVYWNGFTLRGNKQLQLLAVSVTGQVTVESHCSYSRVRRARQ